GMQFAWIPAGKFWMGSRPDEEKRERDETQHEVEITRPFFLSKFETTQEEYEKVTGQNPSYFCETGGGKDQVRDLADTRRFPVECVSRWDARTFCEKLSGLPEERAAGRVYRLPTEAEWEYACRAGDKGWQTKPFSST